jgi:hypothetical protein
MGGTFFALAFLAFTSLTTVDLLLNERQVVMREVRGGYYSPISYLISKLTLDAGERTRTAPAGGCGRAQGAWGEAEELRGRRDPVPPSLAVLLRIIPALLYFVSFYYMAGFKTDSINAATYCLVLMTFSCTVGECGGRNPGKPPAGQPAPLPSHRSPRAG